LHHHRHLAHHLLPERRFIERGQLLDFVIGEIFVENRDYRFLQFGQRFLEFFGADTREIVPATLRNIGVYFLQIANHLRQQQFDRPAHIREHAGLLHQRLDVGVLLSIDRHRGRRLQ